MIIFGYIRVSSQSQKKNFSLSTQKESITSWAKQKKAKVKFFEEIASGKNAANRIVYKEMLCIAEKEKPDFVVVAYLSRFGRNVIDGLTAIQKLESWGVKFVTLDLQLDTSNPIAKAILASILGWEQAQREEQLAKTKAGIKAAKNAGVEFGRKKKKINIKQVLKWIEEGYSLKSIAENKLKISPTTLRKRIKEEGYKKSYKQNSTNAGERKNG